MNRRFIMGRVLAFRRNETTELPAAELADDGVSRGDHVRVLRGDLEPHELGRIVAGRPRGVVRDEHDALARLAQSRDRLRDAREVPFAPPDDAVEVEQERLVGVGEGHAQPSFPTRRLRVIVRLTSWRARASV